MEWLIVQRLTLAQRLLETTEHPIDRVAERVGMGSSTSLRQHFRSRLGVSPAAWRKSFSQAPRN